MFNKDKGLFNGLFDLNHDGKMDTIERALEFAMFMEIVDPQDDDSEDD